MTSFQGLVKLFLDFIGLLVPILVGVALVIFLWGCVRFLLRSGDVHNKAVDKTLLVWGLASLFVITGIWGIIHILSESLGLN